MQINFATNNYFLGHVNTSQLAANGVGGIFYMLLTMVVYGFANGVTVILSRRAGQEDTAGYGKVFTNSCVLGLYFVVAILLLSLLLAPAIFNWQIHNESIKQLANTFMQYRVWGILFYFVQQMTMQLFMSTKNSKYILVCILVSTGVNIFADYVLINGYYGFSAMGIKGAAIASDLAELSFAATAICIILYKKLHQQFMFVWAAKLDRSLTKTTLQVAMPVIFQYFFSIGSWMLFYFYVEHLGQDELAISQVLRSIFGLVGAGSWALASTCNTMVSNLIGQEKFVEVPKAIIKIAGLSLLVAFLLSIVYMSMPATIFGFYTQDTSLVAKAVNPIKIVVIANLLLSISTVVFNAVLGTGNTKVNMLIEFSAIILYIFYIYFVVEKYRMSLTWAWGSEFCYWLSILAMAFSYLKWGSWQKKVV